VGTVDYFPSLYAGQGPFLIGSLEYSAYEQGGLYPYEIWLATAPGISIEGIEARALAQGLVVASDTPQELLRADLLRPGAQGLFGLLSIGFLAAAALTLIGFLVYTLLSFQRRLVELGVLRAIGMGSGQLTALVLCEQVLVIGVGTLVGTGLGIIASRLFVP